MRNRYVLLALDFIKQIIEIIYKFKCAARLVLICFHHDLALQNNFFNQLLGKKYFKSNV